MPQPIHLFGLVLMVRSLIFLEKAGNTTFKLNLSNTWCHLALSFSFKTHLMLFLISFSLKGNKNMSDVSDSSPI